MADWQIRVKALMEGGVERDFHVVAPSNDTLGMFRAKLADQSHIEPCKQRLIFHGRLLTDDGQKLVDTGMRDGCALHMVARPAAAQGRDSAREAGGRAPRGVEGAHASATGFPGFLSMLLGQHPGMGPPQPGTGSQELLQRWQERMSRTIREVHRNFGADDGGEWMAANMNGQYFRIDQEVEAGSQLTDEEFERGSIQARHPISRSSRSDAYAALPGVIPAPPDTGQQPSEEPAPRRGRLSQAFSRVQVVPSRALVNELSHDLFEEILPSIRAIPDNSDFHFSTTESLRPTYMARPDSGDSIDAAGASLTNLGDAFVALGHSLRSVGTMWRQNDTSDNLVIQSQSTLQLLGNLSLASPLAVPLLLAQLAREQSPAQLAESGSTPEQNSARTRSRASRRDRNSISENQRCILDSQARRVHRRQAFQRMAGTGPVSAAVGGAQGQSLHPDPVGMIYQPMFHGGGGMHYHRHDHPDRGAAGRNGAPGNADSTHATDGSASGAREGSDTSGSSQASQFFPMTHSIELVIEHIRPPGSEPSERPLNPGPPPQGPRRPPEMPRRQQEAPRQMPRQQGPPQGPRTHTIDLGMPPDANGGLFNLLGSLGGSDSQSVRSDRSNASTTTTEHSVNNNGGGVSGEPWMRLPRFLGVHMGNGASQPPTVDNLFQHLLSRSANPFSTASVFLGAEAGSTTSTSRRASVSSSTNGPPSTSDAASAAASSAPNNPGPADSAEESTDAEGPTTTTRASTSVAVPVPSSSTSPRAGETRTRSLSTTSAGASEAGTASGSNKRHCPDSDSADQN
ncbi:hypothetical protein GGF46_003217 [Coemansia sp. RSA 552]|nr:hypothetical protein GGF46_003217 [Coemansia sp. RSA 552]